MCKFKTNFKNKIIAFSCVLLMTFSTFSQYLFFNYTKTEASYNLTIHVPSTSSFNPAYHGKVTAFGTCGSDTLEYYLYDDGALYIRNTDKSENDKTFIGKPEDEETYSLWKSNTCELYIESGVYGISENIFSDFKNLKTITYSAGTTTVPVGEFKGCTALNEVISKDDVFPYQIDTYPDELSIRFFAYNKVILTIHNRVLHNMDIQSYRGSAPSEITLPDGITQIADDAIKDENGLTSLTIPEGVTTIGSGNMDDCYNLKTIIFPSTLLTIEGAICSNTAWLNTQYDSSDFAIANNILFSTKDSSTDGDIPNGVTSIASNAFDLSHAASIILPSSVKKICDSAFYGCLNLKEITFNEGLEEIGEYAFSNCFGLTEISFPASLKSIKSKAFYQCMNLSTVTIPDTVSHIESDSFLQTAWYNNILDENNEFKKYGEEVRKGAFESGTEWTLFSNNILYISGNGEIGTFSTTDFEDSTTETGSLLDNVEIIYIEDGVSSIAKDSISLFKNLKVLRVPDSMKNIDIQISSNNMNSFIVSGTVSSEAKKLSEKINCHFVDETEGFDFTGHGRIKGVSTCGVDVYFIRYYDTATFVYGNGQMYEANEGYKSGFFNDWQLTDDALLEYERKKELFIDSSVDYISDYAFVDFNGYTVTGLSPNITHIGICAFKYISDFTNPIVLNENLDYLGDAAFSYSGLQSIDLSKTKLTKIPSTCFALAENLTNIKLPDTITSIEQNAFYGAGISELSVPDSVTLIDECAFYECKNLRSFTFPESLTKLGIYGFYNCSSLEEIDFSKADNITSVGRYCFDNTPYLESAIKQNPLVVEHRVLIDAHYVKGNVEIPEGVTVIANGAFSFMSERQFTIGGYDLVEVNAEYAIDSITFPSTLKYIGDYAFYLRWGTGFNVIELPEGLLKIGKYSFNNCTVQETQIPSTVYDIGLEAFNISDEYCWLYRISYRSFSTDITEVLKGAGISNHFLLNLYFADSSMRSRDVIFPDNTQITAIAGGTFTKNVLRLTLPKTITSISSQAFYYLSNLQTLTVYGDLTYVGDDIFGNNTNIKTICAPKGSLLEKYAADHGIEFVELDKNSVYPEYMLGDANMDGIVNLDDVILILKAALGIINLDTYQRFYANVINNDYIINLDDALYALKIALGII